ncbi:MAG: DUF4007 family protein, partial [Fusobacteriaceae bacterium]
MHSKQKFRIELPYILKLLKIINDGENGKNALKEESGAGENKVVTFIEWLKYLEAIEVKDGEISLTKLGEFYLKVKESHDYIEPLMLYHLARNPELEKRDGHYYFAEILNEYLSTKISDFDNKVSQESIKKTLLDFGADSKYPEFIVGTTKIIADSELGFGKMGLLEEIEGDKKNPTYEIHSYWVEPLVGAYIIYDLWKDGQTAMPINSIINNKYNLGRIFLMDQDAIIETLEEIKALGLIDINLTAGLNQVVKSSKYT